MPTLEVTAYDNEDIWELLEAEKAKHPEYVYPHAPEFRTGSNQVTAILPCRANLDYVAEEPVVEQAVATCEAVKKDGTACGRKLPCRYHRLGTFIKSRLTRVRE